MQNYLELLDKLLICEIPTETKIKGKERDGEEKEEKLLCGTEGRERVIHRYLFIQSVLFINKCFFLCFRQGPIPVQPWRVPALRQPLLGLRVSVAAVPGLAHAPPRAATARRATHATAEQTTSRH